MSRPRFRSSDPALGVSKPWEEVAILVVGILGASRPTERPLLPMELGPGTRERQAPPLMAHVWENTMRKLSSCQMLALLWDASCWFVQHFEI